MFEGQFGAANYATLPMMTFCMRFRCRILVAVLLIPHQPSSEGTVSATEGKLYEVILRSKHFTLKSSTELTLSHSRNQAVCASLVYMVQTPLVPLSRAFRSSHFSALYYFVPYCIFGDGLKRQEPILQTPNAGPTSNIDVGIGGPVGTWKALCPHSKRHYRIVLSSLLSGQDR